MIQDIPKETKGTFTDFIPEGQNPGAMGAGFADFVADETVEMPKLVELTKEAEVVEEATPWKKVVYTCDVCDFSSEYKVALAGHKRKHEAKGEIKTQEKEPTL